MKEFFFLAIPVCLFLISIADAQTFLKVDETQAQIVLSENSAQILLAADASKAANATAKIEFIDPKGATKMFAEKDFALAKGANRLEIPAAIGEIVNQKDFAFYRLRYQIGNASGTISASRICADVFDLEAFAFDLLQENARYVVRVRAIQPIDLNGVKNVRLNGELKVSFDENQEANINLEAETDADGFADFEFQLPKYNRLEDLNLNIKGSKNGFISEISKNLSKYNFQQNAFLYFQTDKPIYQPSQKLRVRTLFFDADKRAIADENLTFSIKDGDGATLQKIEAKTSRFGIAGIEWEIPENAKLGQYEIVAESSRELAFDRRYFKVSRYDLPNFVVNAEAERKFYLPENKNASVTIRADYLFGKPVTKAKVRVVREIEREWDYKSQKYETKEGEVRTGELDADGKFVADFDLTEEHEDFEESGWEKFKDLKFAAYVTDVSTNRTEQRRFDVRLTKKPIHVYLIGDTSNLSKRLPPKFFVTTFYADGTPAACDVKIYQARETSDDDDPKAGKLLGKLKTNSTGAGRIAVPLNALDEDDDELDLVIAAKDAQGNKSLSAEDLNFDDEKPAVQIETDKIVYRAGETVKISIVSSQTNAMLNLDVMRNWRTLHTQRIKLENNRATLEIPYQENFKNALTFVVYGGFRNDYGEAEAFSDNKTVVYPSPFGLRVDAKAEKNVLRPGAEARIDLTASKANGTTNETAFGVVVLDKAIEERARTDSEFGGTYQSFYSDLENLLGFGRGFGGISGFEIDNLDTTKPLAPEAEIAVEIALRRNYAPSIEDSGNFLRELNNAYRPLFVEQFNDLKTSLDRHYSQNAFTPVNDESLRKILALDGINFDSYTDAWGNKFSTAFVRSQDQLRLEIKSAGADEKFDTGDDVTAWSQSFKYFSAAGGKIDRAFADYKTRTDDFIRDYKTLREELRKQDFDLDRLRDAWGRKYRFDFGIENSNYVLKIKSGGWDRKFGGFDDFTIWTNTVDYFTATRANMSGEFRRAVSESQTFPRDETELRAILKQVGFDLDVLKDVFGRNYYVEKEEKSIYTDKVKINPAQKTEITPITQQYVAFTIKSVGKDGAKKTVDDFELIRFAGIVSEKSKDAVLSGGKVKTVPSSSANRGAITGKIVDATGAIIPNAQVTAVWYPTRLKFETNSDADGKFVLADLPLGIYELTFDSAGFKKTIVQNVFVQPQQLTELNMQLEVGNISETVSVIASGESVIDATESLMSVTITQSQIQDLPINGRQFSSLLKIAPGVVSGKQSDKVKVITKSGIADDKNQTEQTVETPRLREYFPETLLWSPEIVADQNGRAQVKFKLADSLTTWKIGVIASTANGDVGIAEREIKAFQPFFAELEPPKFLTVGDEIKLPVAVRNYLSERQTVKAEMAQSDWFQFLNEPTQIAEIAPDSSANAVFDFQATKAVKNGKQKVTAIGTSAGDAIEKPVTIKPNGQEIVATQTELFNQSTTFDINFPANALTKTQRAELKIYPNLFSHVTEAVEGLLQRPYGCGEQTISSTYPNLMILKFAGVDEKTKRTAQLYLKKGYERLLGYKAVGGGFTYWGSGEPNLALTAYAFRFLTDAREFIAVDENVLTETRDYLVKKQSADGSFEGGVMNTAYAARTLARNSRDEKSNAALQKSLAFLREKTAKFDEPYALALYGLALFDAGNLPEAELIAARLEKFAKIEGDLVYWNLETNTPFYGWGTAGRIETTALVVQLLLKIQSSKIEVQSQPTSEISNLKSEIENKNPKSKDQKPKTEDLISKATLFLLKNKDRFGVWHSTQTTINVLDAFLAALSSAKNQAKNVEIQIVLDDENLEKIVVPSDQITPVILDVSEKLNSSNNRIEIKTSGGEPFMAQIVAAHYIDWAEAKLAASNRAVRFDYQCDSQTATIMQEINCAVEIERIDYRGYGMLLAEIGIPPGADVSRESLEAAMKTDWSISRYEILPDRIVVYLWAKDGGTKFNFKFKPRYGIEAQTPASTVYDYYNEEARATIAPLKFRVK